MKVVCCDSGFVPSAFVAAVFTVSGAKPNASYVVVIVCVAPSSRVLVTVSGLPTAS